MDTEAIKVLEELRDHSCDIEDAEFGWYACCNQRDYEGHKPDCERVKALSLAIQALKPLPTLEELERVVYDIKFKDKVIGSSYFSTTEPKDNTTHIRLHKSTCKIIATAILDLLKGERK